MAFRQKLVSDIRAFFKQSKWEDLLHDQIVELLEIRPQSPYQYIQKKVSLRAKLDNTKHSSFMTELLIYCLYANPLHTTRAQIQNKVLYLCVDKYQHTKIRRNQAINLVNSLFLLTNSQQKQKQYFMKLMGQQIQAETVNVCHFAQILYSTILYLSMKKQIDDLDQKLSQIDQHINCQIMEDYLEAVNTQNSILKKMKIKVEADGDLYKLIALAAFEQNES